MGREGRGRGAKTPAYGISGNGRSRCCSFSKTRLNSWLNRHTWYDSKPSPPGSNPVYKQAATPLPANRDVAPAATESLSDGRCNGPEPPAPSVSLAGAIRLENSLSVSQPQFCGSTRPACGQFGPPNINLTGYCKQAPLRSAAWRTASTVRSQAGTKWSAVLRPPLRRVAHCQHRLWVCLPSMQTVLTPKCKLDGPLPVRRKCSWRGSGKTAEDGAEPGKRPSQRSPTSGRAGPNCTGWASPPREPRSDGPEAAALSRFRL